ncbi:hypothetical protein GGS26DRAFT_426882 [Hypomontagnella submonticulosa]|nr:hypothetical protein GGS26DRAFT_426882 [Hypomontagnella submonticulosa]
MGTILLEVPEGLGAEVMAATVVLCVAAIITGLLRAWVRVSNRAIGGDDYLMFIGLAIFICSCVFVWLGCLSGFGATDDTIFRLDPTGQVFRHGRKWLFFYQAGYILCLPFIKLSICAALLRIATAKRYVIPLWIVIVISLISSIIGFGQVLAQCRPISASWSTDPGAADKCNGGGPIQRVTIVISVFSILTDWLCAILPAFLLWKLNMKLRIKVSLAFVLALGALASVATCVRFPYVNAYTNPHDGSPDGLYRAAYIVVWSTIECGIGIVAGSLPPLQPLFKRRGGGSSGMGLSHSRTGPDVPIINEFHQRRLAQADPIAAMHPVHLRDVSAASHGNSLVTTCKADHQDQVWWDSNGNLDDSSSQKLIIMKNTQIDIEYGPPQSESGSDRWV